MIGLQEGIIIVAVVGIFWFGKDKVLDWARSLGEAKKAYKEGDTEESKTKKTATLKKAVKKKTK